MRICKLSYNVEVNKVLNIIIIIIIIKTLYRMTR
jgi:hypothetical protein